MRREEHAVLEHAVHLEVRLDLRVVEAEPRLADLLGVERPVPRRERERRGVRRLRVRADLGLDAGRLLATHRRPCWRASTRDTCSACPQAPSHVEGPLTASLRIAQPLPAVCGAGAGDAWDRRQATMVCWYARCFVSVRRSRVDSTAMDPT